MQTRGEKEFRSCDWPSSRVTGLRGRAAVRFPRALLRALSGFRERRTRLNDDERVWWAVEDL